MKNPALAVLWTVPLLVLLGAGAIGVLSEVEYRSFNAEETRENMRTILGTDEGLPSVVDLEDIAGEKLLDTRSVAFSVAGAGLGIALLPLAVTAVGRSHKNAARELAAALIASQTVPAEPRGDAGAPQPPAA